MTFQTREVSEFLSRSRVFFLRKLLEEIIHQNKEVNQERRDKVQNTGDPAQEGQEEDASDSS